MMDDRLWLIVRQLEAWFDTASADLSADAVVSHRLLKIAEEVGEASAALVGVAGTNPRKGHTHTMTDVAKELSDIAVTALIALGTVTGDAKTAFAEHLEALWQRAQEAGAPPLPPAP